MKEILKSEKRIGAGFLKKLQILDDRFEESEYDFIEHILKDTELIKKIFAIIDDLIKKEDFDSDIRHLILCDFLFSMGSFSLNDPANLILKTSRNKYLQNIRLRAQINSICGHDYWKYLLLHKKLLIGLRINNIVERNIIKTIRGKSWETTIYYSLELKKYGLERFINIGYSSKPFIAAEISGTMYSISSFRNIWKIKRKRREMEDVPASLTKIISANQIGFVLSENLFSQSREDIEKEKNSLLEYCKCANIEEYLRKIRMITEDRKYANSSALGREEISSTEYKEVISLKIEIREEYVRLMQNFQKILGIHLLEKNIFGKKFYLPSFIDNRGRLYYATLMSPTFYKILRNLYEFSEKKEMLDLKESTFYKKIIEYSNEIKEFNLSDENSYAAIVLLIEVGKFFVNKDNKIMIKTEKIIKCGISAYLENKTSLDISNSLYIKKIYSALDKLIKNNVLEKDCIIFKDATASGLQNYGILLGYREDKLECLNLNGDNWCDTYGYLINKFFEPKNSKFAKRKYLKKTIMTIPYNAVWYTCFIKFIESLKEDLVDYKNLSKKEKEDIKLSHKNFYENLKNNIKNEFYENKEGNVKIFKYNKWSIVSVKEYKVNYEKVRDKYTDILYMVTEDEEATQRALEANNMHHLDSKLIEEILQKFEIIPIHDCFGMRLCEIHKIMDEINGYYSKIIGKKIYSIHVIF